VIKNLIALHITAVAVFKSVYKKHVISSHALLNTFYFILLYIKLKNRQYQLKIYYCVCKLRQYPSKIQV